MTTYPSRLALFLLLSVGSQAAAPALPPLPSLPIRDLNGGAASLDAQGFAGTWIIVYTQPQCKPCTEQIRLLKPVTDAGFAGRIVIVGGGMTAKEAQAIQRSASHLNQARWYTDLPRGVQKSLRLRGAPVILGVRAKRVEWILNGIPPKPELLRNAVLSWMRKK